MNSIFVRCSRGTTIAVVVAYTLVAGAIYFGIEHYLELRVDEALTTKGSVLATLVHRDEQKLEFEFDSALMPEFSRKEAPEYFELRGNDGSVLERSPSLGELALDDLAEAADSVRTIKTIRLPDGRRGRALAMQVRPQVEEEGELKGQSREPPMRLLLAQGEENLESVCAALRTGLALGGVALSLLVVLSLRWTLARGLAPLTELGREVDAVTPETLDVEFSSGDKVRELAGIRSRLDELIERLGSALERERRFTSAAAHELRTPLAELKTLGQVSARWPEEHELRARLPQDVLALTARMQNTVESLLAFARATKTEGARDSERVELSLMLSNLLSSSLLRASERGKEYAATIEPGLVLHGDPILIESVLRNLIDNAIAHAPEGSKIEVRAMRQDDWILVETENGRGELVERDLPHLFEPFWRKDSSRHGDAHSGLGLALVEAWVRSWGGTIRAAIVEKDRLCISLRLSCRELEVKQAQSSAANSSAHAPLPA